jgi:ribonuclease HII
MKLALQWTEEYIIGVDEAGRGPLAGPVAIGVSLIPKSTSKAIFTLLKRAGLNDSKQVKEKGREKLFEIISDLQKEGRLKFAVTLVSVDIISKMGITFAVRSGIQKCFTKLGVNKLCESSILEMDGALKIPPGDWKKSSVIIKGDSIKPSIMIASIVAKVTRDRHMKRLAKKYPAYGFDVHKGYGTKRHHEAIEKNGLCKEHRDGWYKIQKGDLMK